MPGSIGLDPLVPDSMLAKISLGEVRSVLVFPLAVVAGELKPTIHLLAKVYYLLNEICRTKSVCLFNMLPDILATILTSLVCTLYTVSRKIFNAYLHPLFHRHKIKVKCSYPAGNEDLKS
jgi:hypothetical protein